MEATLLHGFIWTGPAQLLIASIWQGLALTAFVWTGLKLAAASGITLRASTQFTLWLIAFLLVALLPAFGLVPGLFGAHRLIAATLPASRVSLHLNVYWAVLLEACWAVSSLVCVVRLLAGGRQMRNLFLHSTAVPFHQLDPVLQSVLATGSETRPVQVRLAEAVDAPSIIGFFRPAVVMPRALWSELTVPELQQILLHEVAHFHRGDDWTNLLQKLLRALCPLNPALIWAERHLCRERERACDDVVLEVSGNARAYATCLTRLAESRMVRRAASLAPGLWKRPSELAVRVDSILHRRHTLGPLLSRGILALTLLASVGGAFFLQSCPGLVAFTGPQEFAPRSAPDLASAKIVPARYANPDLAGLSPGGFHEAVFHPGSSETPVVLKPTHAAGKNRPRKLRAVYVSGVGFVLEPTSPGMRRLAARSSHPEAFTVIMFTVVGSNVRPSRVMLPLAAVPEFSQSPNWIAFQI